MHFHNQLVSAQMGWSLNLNTLNRTKKSLRTKNFTLLQRLNWLQNLTFPLFSKAGTQWHHYPENKIQNGRRRRRMTNFLQLHSNDALYFLTLSQRSNITDRLKRYRKFTRVVRAPSVASNALSKLVHFNRRHFFLSAAERIPESLQLIFNAKFSSSLFLNNLRDRTEWNL